MTELSRQILVAVFWASFAATLYTYFLYPLFLLVISRFVHWRRSKQSDHRLHDSDLPTVTMVVSAYNESAILNRKIANCRAIDYPSDKISFLIGSDGSDDDTADILKKISDPRFRTLRKRIRCGKVQMLNRLMKIADSDIVVFSDANTIYRRDAVKELVKLFQEPAVGGVIGKLILTADSHDDKACRTEGLYWRYENSIKQLESRLSAVPTVNGGIFAIRRELYQELPAHAITEDQVLGMNIMIKGYRCLFAEKARAYETVSSLGGELRRRIRISAGNFQSLFLVPGILNPRHGMICFAFISHKLLRWLVPLFMIAMLSANLLLAGKAFYGSTLLFQGLFYAAALLGTVLPKLTGILKILAIPRYFIAMNIAILIGLARFLTGRQEVTWLKASRH